MNGEGRGIEVGQPADLVPGLIAIFVLQVAREILKDEAVHSHYPVLRQRESLIEWGPARDHDTDEAGRDQRKFVHTKSYIM